MAEPVTLYKDDEALTIAAPSEVKRMLGDGWSLQKPESKPEPEHQVEPELDPELENKPTAKRGRKSKA